MAQQRIAASGNWISRINPVTITTGSTILLLLLISAAGAQAQVFQALHIFSGEDGANPEAGVTLSGQKLYGTTSGSAFRLVLNGSGWVLNPLYNFDQFKNGEIVYSKVVFGPDGSLYGTTAGGGLDIGGCAYGDGCGVVYKLQPPASVCRTFDCLWTETVLYRFSGGADGGVPFTEVVFDTAGNLYGTTAYGGNTSCDYGCGVVYKLTPSNGGWTESVIYSFTGGDDGAEPVGGLIFDQAGNLYGTGFAGGSGLGGVIFELTPSNGKWTETTLHGFQAGTDGSRPQSTLIFDSAGNLYGVASLGGPKNGGTAFEWSPSNGGTYTVLFSFASESNPTGTLAFDPARNLYGTTANGGANQIGTVFRLHPSNGSWTETDLYTFQGLGDGANPYSGVTMDQEGHLFGTALNGGGFLQICANGCGSVWVVTP